MADARDPLPRRGLWRHSLRRIAELAADTLDGLRRSRADPRPVPPAWRTRPPGAIEERAFLDACTACDDCVAACPAWAIHKEGDGDPHPGKPYLEPGKAACALCEDPLPCAAACSTGALKPLPRAAVELGLARIRPERCLVVRGEECRLCVSWCPVGEEAIYMAAAGPEIVEAGCTGCGLCAAACPSGAIRILGRLGAFVQWPINPRP